MLKKCSRLNQTGFFNVIQGKKFQCRQFCQQSSRRNTVGIQMITEELRETMFGKEKTDLHLDNVLLKRMISHLRDHGLLTSHAKNETLEIPDSSAIRIPPTEGSSLESHFQNLALEYVDPYVKMIEQLITSSEPLLPQNWNFEAGWVRYPFHNLNEAEKVSYPIENCLVFDVETIKKFPVLACAMSQQAIYLWCSDWLVNGSGSEIPSDSPALHQLIPMSESNHIANLVIGHNVSYDRSFISQQYVFDGNSTRFLDTMSLHMAVSGLTSFQRILFNARKTGSTRKEVREMVFRDPNRADMYIARKQEQGEDFNLLSGQRFKWMDTSTLNNLRDVYALYCPSEDQIEKELRNVFISGTIEDVREDFQNLASYCFRDVAATFKVFQKLWPLYQERFPHPVTLAGMFEMGRTFLPVDRSWEQYISTSDSTYHAFESTIRSLFVRLANDAVALLNGKRFKSDPWLWDLNWSVQDLKLNKAKVTSKQQSPPSNLESFEDVINSSTRLPKRRPHLPGYPKWYTELIDQNIADEMFGPTKISQQMRLVPKLLRLTWDGYLIHYDEKHGWGYLVPSGAVEEVIENNESPYANFPTESALLVSDMLKYNDTGIIGLVPSDADRKDVEETSLHRIELARMISDAKGPKPKTESPKAKIEETSGKMSIPIQNDKSINEGKFCPDVKIRGFNYYRIPHKDGMENRVGNPLSKSFLSKFADGTLRANCGEDGNKIVEFGQVCSYWKNNRDRITDQLVVWLDDKHQRGVILPRVITAGTVTRRAVEPTWLTASNARTDRLGSELKAMVHAPDGYSFVGADVDSQELWIAAVIGDAYFAKVHGSTALGWMTLQGNKNDGTDMHSKTASTLLITRDQAKIINYGRIYGAGRQFAERLLMQFNPKLTPAEAKERVEKMYALTKGVIRFMPVWDQEAQSFVKKRVWYGGSESAMFNKLEEIARSPEPRTPVLGCRISRALEPANVHGDFITSRINWVVQSSAVDYLHLMLVATRWLFKCYGVTGRFAISIHDEVRYLVKSEDKYKAALALHVANLFTRAMFAHKLGFSDLPACVAFFSSVDIDKCLRKEPFYDCITPSNIAGLKKTYGIEAGKTININQTLDLLQKYENTRMRLETNSRS